MDVTCRVGALEFRLSRVEHHRFDAVDTRPFTLLADGTEVRSTTQGPVPYLVVDHRNESEGLARIEYWDAVSTSEAPIRGLITICEAMGGQY